MQPAVAAKHFSRSGTRQVVIGFLLIAGTHLACPQARAQTDFTRIYGSNDQSVPMPAFVGRLGQKDAGALQEILNYRNVVNLRAWEGMQATGTLTDNSGDADQATLTNLNSDKFRLDVQTPRGERSTRMSGSYGKTLEVDGKTFAVPPLTAKIGLLAFPRLLVATFPSSNMALIDRGLVQIDNQSLHRITIEEPVFSSETTADPQNINVTDLYFDPSTHLLLKSASAVQLDSADRERYLIVISYSNYQDVQKSLIPFTYSQSLNGQRQWMLQLSSPDLQPAVDSSYFHF